MPARAQQNPAGAVDVVVIGAGQSGLAMSHCLSALSVEHVVLERGEVANSWNHERWDSLRLLTPNWLTRLPGVEYSGDDPDGFMRASEVAAFISGYATMNRAPVRTGTIVQSVQSTDSGYRIVTNRGEWRCRAVVLASGGFNRPTVPALARGVPESIRQVTAHAYRNADQLDGGGVLVVGASATGLQLADEIRRSGREVTLAVGEHVRMPRSYRGRDILHWMNVCGVLDQRIDETDDMQRARRVPSAQLVGTPERTTLDLNTLSAAGVRVIGRLAGVRDGAAQFSGSLRNVCALADLKMNRLLDAIDDWIDANDLNDGAEPPTRFAPTDIPAPSSLSRNLNDGGIRSIVWATGYRPDYSWLDMPVLDRKGAVRHEAGVAEAPGLYLMGLPFMRRRKSSFLHGAEDDARELSAHLKAFLDGQSTRTGLRKAG